MTKRQTVAERGLSYNRKFEGWLLAHNPVLPMTADQMHGLNGFRRFWISPGEERLATLSLRLATGPRATPVKARAGSSEPRADQWNVGGGTVTSTSVTKITWSPQSRTTKGSRPDSTILAASRLAWARPSLPSASERPATMASVAAAVIVGLSIALAMAAVTLDEIGRSLTSAHPSAQSTVLLRGVAQAMVIPAG